jgi:hypothetical protein
MKLTAKLEIDADTERKAENYNFTGCTDMNSY